MKMKLPEIVEYDIIESDLDLNIVNFLFVKSIFPSAKALKQFCDKPIC